MGNLRAGLCCLLALLIAGCSTPSANTTQEIVIGAVASLTGPAGEQGRNWMEGAQLAVADANAAGVRAKLVVEDDQTQSAQAVAAFQKLVTVNGAQGIIGGTWDFLAASSYPLAQRLKVPFITPSNPVEMYGAEVLKNPWVFTNALSIAAVRDAALEFCKRRGVRSVLLLYPSLPFGTGHATMLRDALIGAGISIVTNVEFVPGPAYLDEIRWAIARTDQSKPDLILAVLDVAGIEQLLSELQRKRLQIPLLTTQHLDAAFAMTSDPKRYLHSYAVYPRVESVDFASRYQARFGRAPRVFAAEGYDAARFLIEGIRQGVRFDSPEAVLSVTGVSGTLRLPAPDRIVVRSGAQVMSTESGVFAPERR